MVRQILPAIGFIVFLSSCTAFKSLNFIGNKQVISTTQPAATQPNKFIDDISVTPVTEFKVQKAEPQSGPAANISDRPVTIVEPIKQEITNTANILANREAEVETASAVQFKYAVLMNTEVESLPSKQLLETVDDWYGVRYRTGGNTKSGVDCSGFTVAVYSAVFGIMLPRVSREQYRISRKISTTELKEGDLVFFNTTGRGVSHVGVYLGNNKFIHASVSKGVMVNDLFESYYLKRFVGAGRIDDKQMVASGE
ncbi:MAG TPA: NlpC/P60 family protein [Chitinophagaceae bacterium]|nr:NlpC/P60 family protein [Chitinophagaceae bacterium]